MPDDRYSDWVTLEFCETCGARIKGEEMACLMCGSYITLANERIKGKFSPVDAAKMQKFI